MFFVPTVGIAIERVCCFELYQHYPDAYYRNLDNKDKKIEIISDTIDELAQFHYNELDKSNYSIICSFFIPNPKNYLYAKHLFLFFLLLSRL